MVEVAQETARLPIWPRVFDVLNDNNVKSLKPTEARELMDQGYVSACASPMASLNPFFLLLKVHCSDLQMHLLHIMLPAMLIDVCVQVLVDVRPPHIFEKAHPAGAKNVPLFQKVNFSNFSVTGYLRAAALALNGVEPVEPNPRFGASQEMTTSLDLCPMLM